MNCQTAADYMMKYFDGQCNDIENAQLKQHLKNCKKCSEDFESMSELFQFIKNDTSIEPPEDFEAGVMKKIKDLELLRKKRTEKVLFGMYLLATILLSGIVILFLLDMRETILRSMEMAGGYSGILYAVYFVFNKFYEFIDMVANILLWAGIILSNFYYVFFVAAGLFLLLTQAELWGKHKTAGAGTGGK